MCIKYRDEESVTLEDVADSSEERFVLYEHDSTDCLSTGFVLALVRMRAVNHDSAG